MQDNHNFKIGVFSDTNFIPQPLLSIAKLLNLPITKKNITDTDKFDAIIFMVKNRLTFQLTGKNKTGEISVDFINGRLGYRIQRTGKNQSLARAIGLHKNPHIPYIMDATAGFGSDAAILASLGYNITLIEKNPIVFALLKDGIQRASLTEKGKTIASRMTLVHADSQLILHETQQHHLSPDIIYIDPMFPPRQKSALTKKNMQSLHQLIGQTDKSDKLLLTALNCAKQKVIVKRPVNAQDLANKQPTYRIKEKTIRFDIYLSEQKQKQIKA